MAVIRAVKVNLTAIFSHLQKFKRISFHDSQILSELDCPMVLVHENLPRFISWGPLVEGRLKMNVDGGSCGNPGMSGGGGVFRDYQGKVVAGFAHFYGHATDTIAECREQCLMGCGFVNHLACRIYWRRLTLVYWCLG